MRSVEGDMSDIYFEVIVWICLACITVQCERFPLGRERGVGDEISKRVATPRLWEW